MTKQKTYNIFLFLSSFTRNLIEVFSLVLLYKKGYTINNLIFFLFLLYTFGILSNYISLKLYYKLVLILSSLIYGISFIYLSIMNNNLSSLIILSILLSIGNYSYHVIRHFLALTMINNKKRNTNNLIIINYLAIIISSLIGTYLINKLSIFITSIIIFSLSFISIIPILKQPKLIISNSKNKSKVIIPKRKIIFNILEQFKVILLELQPLFIYIYIDNSTYYVGIFNILTHIASLIVIYYLTKKIKYQHTKYYTLILGLILFLKLNIKNSYTLLFLALLEGIFIKIYETISLNNLYNYQHNNIKQYLLIEELIFFITKSLIIAIYLILNLNLYTIMHINIIGIIISGFFIKKEKK